MKTAIDVLLKQLSNPARRAIQAAGITTLEDLTMRSEKEIAALHGIGKSALETIRKTLKEFHLSLHE